MLLGRPISRLLFIVKFWESQKLYVDFGCAGVSTPNPVFEG